ncbi:adhesion G-protein coupled receptor F3 isoform X1 [Paramormyrops kingsleyae]|uniref:adhesion G-protein coupled receptor F3 isoform X1 n=1 Tax=Paramormyrops kingsleyae TaxID=1676925 RepID=UPI003B97796F
MWLWPIMTLYALGMFPSQATSSTGDSTQMYYADLEVDEGASQNITDLLPKLLPFILVLNSSSATVNVTYSNITTACDIRGEKSICHCDSQYDWDPSVCDLYPGCCNQYECISNSSLAIPVCLPKSRVTVTGSLTLGLQFTPDLNNPATTYYQTMVQQVQTNLSQIYSQCSGFDSLTIIGFRSGSVIVNFQMILNVPLNSAQFVNMTSTLESKLSGSLQVATIGMVTGQAPQGPLCYNTSYTLGCDLGDTTFGNCNWTLTQGNNTVNIVTGTEVTLGFPCNLTLLKTSKLWKVTCTYTNRKSQVKNATVTIPVIYNGTTVCKAEVPWSKAKNATTATLPCPASIPAVGSLTRNCSGTGDWGQNQSTCVNLQLYSILQDALDLQKGYGDFVTGAFNIFGSLKNSTGNSSAINTHQNINASVNILSIVGNATSPNVTLNDSILPTLLSSASNLLEESLHDAWTPKNRNNVYEYLSVLYLRSMEKLIQTVELNSSSTSSDNYHPNVQLTSFSGNQTNCNNIVFNVSVSTPGQTSGSVNIIGYRTLVNLLPSIPNMNLNSIVMSTVMQNSSLAKEIAINFSLINERPPDYEMLCVFWNFSTMTWSDEGCYWNKTSSNEQMICICNHLTSFSTLMSKSPIELPYLDQITYVGLAASVSSLIVCLVIEFMVWNTVVKSNVSHFRHTALVNISLCLLMGDTVFLVNSFYESAKWCGTFTVIKHFCYLSMFFWMLCLSTMLLHQLIFVFHQMRKKVYLTISISIGYVCPLIIVLLTYKIYNDGAEDVYYNARSCWLNYKSPFNGSIHAFIFPVLTIVLINFFSMMVVITKLLRPQVSEGSKGDQKEMAKSILKAIVFLTPVFGITWILGFFVLVFDLTEGFWAYFVNYAFTIINSLQGVLILLTGCFGEKKVRDALLQRFISPTTNPSKNENSTKGSSIKK